MKIFAYKTPLLCNQRCFFCVTNAQYKNKQYNIPIKKVIKDLLVLKKQWYTHISIEWGEPTLVDNLNDLIKEDCTDPSKNQSKNMISNLVEPEKKSCRRKNPCWEWSIRCYIFRKTLWSKSAILIKIWQIIPVEP